MSLVFIVVYIGDSDRGPTQRFDPMSDVLD